MHDASCINIETGATVTLRGFTLQNGAGYAGGILNAGTLNVQNSIITNNTAENYGGGIYNEVILNLQNSTVKNNIAESLLEESAIGMVQ